MVVIAGMTATGKTTAGWELARRLGIPSSAIDGDKVWQELARTHSERIVRHADRVLPRLLWFNLLLRKAHSSLERDGVAIVSASSKSAGARRVFELFAAAEGAQFEGFWLTASRETTVKRSVERKARSRDDPEPNNVSWKLASSRDPYEVRRSVHGWTHVNAEQSKETVVEKICCQIHVGQLDMTEEVPQSGITAMLARHFHAKPALRKHMR